jgi:CHAT domain-containing protein
MVVMAWMPEVAPTPAGLLDPQDATLLEIASLARRGHFQQAAERLREMRERAGEASPRLKHLCLLWEGEIERRRLELLSGGESTAGNLRQANARLQTLGRRRAIELDQVTRQMPPAQAIDGIVSFRYLSGVLAKFGFTMAGLRANRIHSEFRQNRNMPNPVDAGTGLAQMTLAELNQLELTPGAWLDGVTRQLIGHLVRGKLADAQGNLLAAEASYRAALSEARRAGRDDAEAQFHLLLGDLEALPYGEAVTLGWNLFSESSVRAQLEMGLTPRAVQTPSPDALQRAERHYQDAEAALRRVPQTLGAPDIPLALLMLRRAHLSRLRGDVTTALNGYRETAAVAAREMDLLTGAAAQAAVALMSRSRRPIEDAIRALKQTGAEGAVSSLGQMVHSWAMREVAQGDVDGAVARLRMGGNALLAAGLGREAADLFFVLSNLQGEMGRLDDAVETAQTAVREHDRFLEAVAAARETAPLLDPDGRPWPDLERVQADTLWFERQMQFTTLNRLLFIVRAEAGEEGSQRWRERQDALERALEISARKATEAVHSLATPQQAAMAGTLLNMAASQRRRDELLLPLFSARTCETWLNLYDTIRPQLVALNSEMNDPIFLIEKDADAANCASSRLDVVHTGLRRLQPVEELSRALAPPGTQPSLETQAAIQGATLRMRRAFNLAAMTGAGEVLAAWVDELEALTRADGSLRNLVPSMRLFRALSLLGKDQPAAARDLLRQEIAGEFFQRDADTNSRGTVLLNLIEAHSRLNDDPEAALWALERLRWESDALTAQRTGFSVVARGTVERAMLVRKAALEGGLNPEDAARLVALEARDPASAASAAVTGPNFSSLDRATEAIGPAPTRQDVRAALQALPPRTTVLLYHADPRALTVWCASAEHPLRMIRLAAPPADTLRLLTNLQDDLAAKLGTWQTSARVLYERLIAPLGPLPADETLVIVRPLHLGAVPFELLGPSLAAPLLRSHPVVYANRLTRRLPGPERYAANASTSPREASVTVAVGIARPGTENAEDEAREVAALMDGTTVLGRDATVERVLRAAREARWLHVATHGFLDRENPYLSFLSLADGCLEAWRLFREAPRTEGIVLSACETTRSAGGNNVAGLTSGASSLAAFVDSGGARWILATLWTAKGGPTRTIIAGFYRAMRERGLDPPRALQQARLNYLGERVIPPYYWCHLTLSMPDPSSLRPNRP